MNGLVHVHLVALIRCRQRGNIGEALNTRPTFRSRCAVDVLAELLGAVDESRWHDDRRDGWARRLLPRGHGGDWNGVGTAAGVRVARFTTAITDATAITSATIAKVASPRRSHRRTALGDGSAFATFDGNRLLSRTRR